jgi:hypothetical protein
MMGVILWHMALPKLPKKEPRAVAATFRLSKSAMDDLRVLASAHNLSQASVIDILIKTEYQRYLETRNGNNVHNNDKHAVSDNNKKAT